MHACIYTRARLATPTNGSPMWARRTRAHVLRPCARVCACDRAATHPGRRMRARSVGVDRVWLGSQAFNSASAFNAVIGAWNTARVTSLEEVCAAFSARSARHGRRDALGGVVDGARAVVRGGAAAARARARVFADAWAGACADAHV
jgi:hypothetical protein